jgi:hypothetical protein
VQVHREKARAGVDVFVARHVPSDFSLRFDLDLCFGSRHDAWMMILFFAASLGPGSKRGEHDEQRTGGI